MWTYRAARSGAVTPVATGGAGVDANDRQRVPVPAVSWPLIVVQSEGMQTVQTLIAALKQAEVADWGMIMAVITLSVFPTVAIYIMMQRYFVQGVALSGIKG